MHGKRSWYVIRKYLLEAIEDKQTRNAELKNLLFIPESHDPEKQAGIAARRQQTMAPAQPGGSHSQSLMLIGTFQLTESGFAVLQDVSLMNVTQEWLPFETREEYQLILAMVEQQRRFAKGLRFKLPLNRPLAGGRVSGFL